MAPSATKLFRVKKTYTNSVNKLHLDITRALSKIIYGTPDGAIHSKLQPQESFFFEKVSKLLSNFQN